MSQSELAFIDRLRELATHPAARGLDDDAAVLGDLVITHDTIAEGVHFMKDDPAASVGWKLVAVNLSDLAAKGATPVAAVMSVALGSEEWNEAFLSGVSAACEAYGLPLVGGDTIALPAAAPQVLGMTIIGRSEATPPSRSGGRPGDALWVVGTIGDGVAGLMALTGDKHSEGPLVEAYRRPIPQLAVGKLLAHHASAMMDVSDGLLLDLLRIMRASRCGAEVDLDAVPLSRAFIADHGQTRDARLFATTGGDDYALLAALPPDFDPGLRLSLPSGTILARIGTLTDGSELRLGDANGDVPLPEPLGYEHRHA